MIGNHFSLVVEPGCGEEIGVGTAARCVDVDVYYLDGVIGELEGGLLAVGSGGDDSDVVDGFDAECGQF